MPLEEYALWIHVIATNHTTTPCIACGSKECSTCKLKQFESTNFTCAYKFRDYIKRELP